jgi:GntR family transcriptional regulator
VTHFPFRLQPSSGVPIYLQLMEQIRHAVESCALAPGDQLPAIRVLAQQLVISPNTVVEAYTELDREGVIELRQGSGAFVADREGPPRSDREVRFARAAMRDLVARLRRHGFSEDEIRRFLEAELAAREEARA